MTKIITRDELNAAFTQNQIQAAANALDFVDHDKDDDDNIWLLREQCRMDTGIYRKITLTGDDPDHFLHVSTDDADKVSYTKNDEKAKNDIQTRTTLEKYCTKFGLDSSTAVYAQATIATESAAQAEIKPAAQSTDLCSALQTVSKAIQAAHREKAHAALDTYLEARDAFDLAEAQLNCIL